MSQGTTLVEQLANIAGFDPNVGLRFCAGRPESLKLVLQQYLELYRGASGVDALAAHLEAGRVADLQRLAHSLNGASGVIGANRIQGLAAALEASLAECRPKAELADPVEQLRTALDTLLRALDSRIRCFENAPVPAQRPVARSTACEAPAPGQPRRPSADTTRARPPAEPRAPGPVDCPPSGD